MDAKQVNVSQIRRSAEAKGYVTDAEHIRNRFVFAGLLPQQYPPTRDVVQTSWRREVTGACWHSPIGPGSDIPDLEDDPVIHAS